MRILEAKGRRELQDHEKLKLNYFLVHRWEFLKEKKRQYLAHFKEIQRHREFKQQWMKLILTHQVTKQAYKSYDVTRDAVIKYQRQLYCSFLMKVKFKTYCKHLAPTRAQRGVQRIKQAFSFVSLGFMDRKQEHAKTIMKAFLTETRDIYVLR